MNGLRFLSMAVALLLGLVVVPLGCSSEQTFKESCRGIEPGDDWETVTAALTGDGRQYTCASGSLTVCEFFEGEVRNCAGQPRDAEICSCSVVLDQQVTTAIYSCTLCSEL